MPIKEKKERLHIYILSQGIYHLKDNDVSTEFKYYLWKAEQIFDDFLYITANAYNYNSIPEALLAEDGFTEILYVVDKKNLMMLYEQAEMVKVQRKYEEASGFNRVVILIAVIAIVNELALRKANA